MLDRITQCDEHRRDEFAGKLSMQTADEIENQSIRELIERECTVFLCRDFEAWAECILQESRLVRLGACMGGIMDYTVGWEAHRESILKFFERFPVPNPEMAGQFRRTNWSIQTQADMAWASFDQYGPRSEDPLVTVGLSHQVRILEKQGDNWKIAMLGHGDTSLEYFDYPAIRVDRDQTILWMNDQAKAALKDHPALMKSGPSLRSRYGKDRVPLAEAIIAMSELTVMDLRPTIGRSPEAMTRTVLLGGETDEGMHIVWVTCEDKMLLVKFSDKESAERQMVSASDLFGLSATQTRLAALLLEGLDTPKAAERMGITLNTAKTHLQRLFDKVGVRSQSALVSALLGVASPK